MNLILQPEGSSLCGQCCVAMAAGVSLSQAITAVRHDHGTQTWELITALALLGVNCAPRLRRVKRNLPVFPKSCIICVARYATVDGTRRQREAHWMVYDYGRILDPGGCWPDGYERAGWRITSYLEIL